MFNGMFGGGDGPGMGDLMKLLAPLLGGGFPQGKVTKFIETVATPENIKEYSGKLIEGYTNMQNANGHRYVLYAESTPTGNDIVIRVWHRVNASTVEPLRELYLSQITQADLISLISLFFNNAPATKSITAPGE